MFWEVSLRALEVHSRTGPQALTTQRLEVEENGNIVPREVKFSRWITAVHDSFYSVAMGPLKGKRQRIGRSLRGISYHFIWVLHR